MPEAEDATFTCQRCGKVRPAAWVCACKDDGAAEPLVPEGWDPELTRTARPRLPLTLRPDRGS